jgi:hypothetical protein
MDFAPAKALTASTPTTATPTIGRMRGTFFIDGL